MLIQILILKYYGMFLKVLNILLTWPINRSHKGQHLNKFWQYFYAWCFFSISTLNMKYEFFLNFEMSFFLIYRSRFIVFLIYILWCIFAIILSIYCLSMCLISVIFYISLVNNSCIHSFLWFMWLTNRQEENTYKSMSPVKASDRSLWRPKRPWYGLRVSALFVLCGRFRMRIWLLEDFTLEVDLLFLFGNRVPSWIAEPITCRNENLRRPLALA